MICDDKLLVSTPGPKRKKLRWTENNMISKNTYHAVSSRKMPSLSKCINNSPPLKYSKIKYNLPSVWKAYINSTMNGCCRHCMFDVIVAGHFVSFWFWLRWNWKETDREQDLSILEFAVILSSSPQYTHVYRIAFVFLDKFSLLISINKVIQIQIHNVFCSFSIFSFNDIARAVSDRNRSHSNHDSF